MTETVASPPPTVETHDPIPESNWLWRRVFVFALCTVICIGIWVMVITMVNLAGGNPSLIVGAFVKIIGWLLLLVWFAMTYYIVGTSGEQVVKIVQTAGLFKSGITQAVTQTATSADGSQAVAHSVTGPAAVTQPVATVPPESPPWPTS
jgi:hypothetical protein